MLSVIYQIAYYYEKQYGDKPNVLFLNPVQFSRLRQSFDDELEAAFISKRLGMLILISQDINNIRVAYLTPRQDHGDQYRRRRTTK